MGFSLREGWRSFKTLGIGGLLTLGSLTTTLCLSALAAEGYFLLKQWNQSLLEQFEVEAFLAPDIEPSVSQSAMESSRKIPGVASVKYISRDEAAKRFREQFQSDILDLLGYNPLPPSLIVSLSTRDPAGKSLSRVAEQLKAIRGVEDVIYQGELLSQIESFYQRTGRGVFTAIGVALLFSLIFTGLTIAAAIRQRGEFIHIVLMCGGSRMMARGPFLALGAYYGALAGMLAGAVSGLVVWLIKVGWEIQARLPLEWIPLLILTGIVIGGLTAGWVAGRRIRAV